MTSVAHLQPMPMRRSQRRKNKYLNREETEYSIPNPYRTSYSHQCLPDILGKQLSKMDYLSTRSLNNLSFPQTSSHQQMNDLLLKMRTAAKKQQQEFDAIITWHQQEEKRRKLQQHHLLQEDLHSEHIEHPHPKNSEESMDIEDSRDMLHSENVSIFGDNYEADHRMVFYSDHSVGHVCMKDEFDLI